MPKYGIYALDGSPVAIEALDTRTNEIVQATVFVSRELAQKALDSIPEEKNKLHGKFEIRELTEA